jgi:hypothetical protein
LAPFRVDDPGADEWVIDELVARSRVERGQGDLLRLTPAGTRVDAVLLERIRATRQLLVRGVTRGSTSPPWTSFAGWPGTSTRPGIKVLGSVRC